MYRNLKKNRTSKGLEIGVCLYSILTLNQNNIIFRVLYSLQSILTYILCVSFIITMEFYRCVNSLRGWRGGGVCSHLSLLNSKQWKLNLHLDVQIARLIISKEHCGQVTLISCVSDNILTNSFSYLDPATLQCR